MGGIAQCGLRETKSKKLTKKHFPFSKKKKEKVENHVIDSIYIIDTMEILVITRSRVRSLEPQAVRPPITRFLAPPSAKHRETNPGSNFGSDRVDIEELNK